MVVVRGFKLGGESFERNELEDDEAWFRFHHLSSRFLWTTASQSFSATPLTTTTLSSDLPTALTPFSRPSPTFASPPLSLASHLASTSIDTFSSFVQSTQGLSPICRVSRLLRVPFDSPDWYAPSLFSLPLPGLGLR